MSRLFLLFLYTFLFSCQSPFKELNEKSVVKYFPDSIKSDILITNKLNELNEPSIYNCNDSIEAFRLIFVPAVNWNRIRIIRIEKKVNDSLVSVFVKIPESEGFFQSVYDLKSVLKPSPILCFGTLLK